MFAFATVLAFFAFIEGSLWLSGFEAVADVERMQFTFPIDDYNRSDGNISLKRDPQLFWKSTPAVKGHNSHGFYGPEFTEKKAEGVFRIVCIGDSCTHFGPTSYSQLFQQRLDEIAPGRFEVINAGVIGYTSYQGLRLMETRVANWDPDLVTVYFGWNDHWHARGLMDKEQIASEPSGASKIAGTLRSVQLIRMLTGKTNQTNLKMRVQLPDYESNLQAIADICDSIGSETWFLTAPHAMDLYVPDYLVSSGEVSDPGNLVALHQKYNEVVRAVAKATNSDLIDFESMFDQLQKRPLFLDDNTHLTTMGKELVAKTLSQHLLDTKIAGVSGRE